MKNKLMFAALFFNAASAHAINSDLRGVILSFDDIRCGESKQEQKANFKKYTPALLKPRKSYGVTVIPHEYSIDSRFSVLNPLDTKAIAFNWYRTEIPSGYKFELLSYSRYIILGPENDKNFALQNYMKIETDLREKLGVELGSPPKIQKHGNTEPQKWWLYEQKPFKGELFVNLGSFKHKGQWLASVEN
ncbi:hypothetical protein [Pseudoalteromonas luteoviolacea]|uniref:Uncharacterized protein n=1 Tax=Pseudoalteromonas luteoviolacea H33 TaxID=1365251 RepID=A0A167AHR6_9GAMM|nr:hypothetical protein [Pseudoalteromonas luteoviolacea]KZN45396.1 hypothetical protein N476_05100 [Pseudoalteromonas luteoviolacea H33]KZN70740.1 hypothetical protein N477_04940 [Pseudoalteromonas luteoviolacea H33-S]